VSSSSGLHIQRAGLSFVLLSGSLLFAVVFYLHAHAAETSEVELDPAAWGSDHVGEPLPEFATGEECLFCHRNIGGSWSENRHARTMREAGPDETPLKSLHVADPAAANEVTMLLGAGTHTRFLKPAAEYGKAEILSAHWQNGADQNQGELKGGAPYHWDAKKFATSCVGCHASGVDGHEHTFSSPSLDCYTCHGVLPPEHTTQKNLALLTKQTKDDPKVITSICASCHIRSGRSRSTGLPYSNQFVPGDNLFRDFEADFSEKGLAALDPGDRHILENVRDVVIRGGTDTCLTCHEVHRQSTSRHRRLLTSETCTTCHEPGEPLNSPIPYVNHSKICEY
jgi:hypothetical protein